MVQVAMAGLTGHLHVDLGGGEALLLDVCDGQCKIGELESGQIGAEVVGVESGGDEGAEDHVPAGAVEAVEIADPHPASPSDVWSGNQPRAGWNAWQTEAATRPRRPSA